MGWNRQEMINGTGATCATDTTKWCPLDLLPFSLGKEVRNHCVPNEHWMMLNVSTILHRCLFIPQFHIRHVFYGFLQGKPGYLVQHISTMFNHSWPSKSMRHSRRQWRNNRGHQGKSSGLADAAWHRLRSDSAQNRCWGAVWHNHERKHWFLIHFWPRPWTLVF